jgi:hypothetical protein
MALERRVIGKFPVTRGVWDSNTDYYKSNIVTRGGSSFMSVSEDTMKGAAYEPSVVLEGNDFVIYYGTTRQDGTNDKWQLVAYSRDSNDISTGYLECDSSASADKVINAVWFSLDTSIRLIIKMINANTKSNPTLNINGSGAKPIYYDGALASSSNSWEAGEVLDVYYDGTNFYTNNIAGGGTFATGEKVKNVGIDDEPTAGSDNLVKSSGVKTYVDNYVSVSQNTETAGVDLYLDYKQAADVVPNVIHVEIQGSWQTPKYPCVLLPNTVYVLKMIQVQGATNSPVLSIDFFDENDVGVAKTGFQVLNEVGDSCEITVARKTAKASIYVNGSVSKVSIESKVSTIEELSELNEKVEELKAKGYYFAGVANTATNPGTPTSKVFWISYGIGVHQYFGNYNATSPLTLFYWYNNSNWVGESIGRNMTYAFSPFTPSTTNIKFNSNLDCIKDINIYTKNPALAKEDFYLRYLWKDNGANHNYYMEIKTSIKSFSWNINNYSPLSDLENIVLYNNKDYIVVTIDWSKITAGVVFDSYAYIKKEKIHLVNDNGLFYNGNTNNTSNLINKAVINAYVIPESIFDLSTIYFISYFWKNYGKSLSTFLQVKKQTLDGVVSVVGEKTIASPVGKQKIELGNTVIYIDWDLVSDGTFTESSGVQITARYEIPIDEANDGYAIKDTIKKRLIVDKNDSTYYATIGDAIAAVENPSHQNQYEIIVTPGIYNEVNLFVPPYTHIFGAHRDSVLVTSKGISGSQPVFEQRDASSKLSNMTIESHTGYCIHIDVGLDKKTIYNENIHFKKYLTNGGTNSIIGGGSFQLGTLFEFNNCIFEGCAGVGYPSELGVHTQAYVNMSNTKLKVIGCKFINAFVNVGSVGSFGKNLCEVTNCRFDSSVVGLKYWLSLDGKTKLEKPEYFLANKLEWDVVGGNNINLCPNYQGQGDGVCIESASAVFGQKIEISGSIVDALFGIVQYGIGGNVIKARAKGIYLVKDEQVSNKDIYQMWKRLGDCSTTNKTLSVSINGGTAQTVTLTEDYLTSKKSETDIIAQINAQLDGVVFKKYSLTNYYSHIYLNEIAEIICNDNNDVEEYCIVDNNGNRLAENATTGYLGIALTDAAKNERVRVWTGKELYLGLADGSYSVESNGKLVSSATHIIGVSTNGIFKFV